MSLAGFVLVYTLNTSSWNSVHSGLPMTNQHRFSWQWTHTHTYTSSLSIIYSWLANMLLCPSEVLCLWNSWSIALRYFPSHPLTLLLAVNTSPVCVFTDDLCCWIVKDCEIWWPQFTYFTGNLDWALMQSALGIWIHLTYWVTQLCGKAICLACSPAVGKLTHLMGCPSRSKIGK